MSAVPDNNVEPQLMKGHYAILFAKALGADVYAFSHSESKEEDIKTMGATCIVTVPGFTEKHQRMFDLIISTRDVAEGFPIGDYLS